MAGHVFADFEGGDDLDEQLREMAVRLGQGGQARVGFLEGSNYPAEDGGMPVAQVAFWNEFGTANAPARPYFRNMIEDQSPTWAPKLAAALRATGYRLRPALELVAADIRGHLIESINLLRDPPNAPYTIEKKGFDKPLIDSAVMVRSTDFVVEMGRVDRD